MTIYLKWKNRKNAEGNWEEKGDTFIPGVIAINIQFERNTVEIKYHSGSVQVNTFELSELEDINWYLANPEEMLTNKYAESLNTVAGDSFLNDAASPIPFGMSGGAIGKSRILPTGKPSSHAVDSDLNDLLKNLKSDAKSDSITNLP